MPSLVIVLLCLLNPAAFIPVFPEHWSKKVVDLIYFVKYENIDAEMRYV